MLLANNQTTCKCLKLCDSLVVLLELSELYANIHAEQHSAHIRLQLCDDWLFSVELAENIICSLPLDEPSTCGLQIDESGCLCLESLEVREVPLPRKETTNVSLQRKYSLFLFAQLRKYFRGLRSDAATSCNCLQVSDLRLFRVQRTHRQPEFDS